MQRGFGQKRPEEMLGLQVPQQPVEDVQLDQAADQLGAMASQVRMRAIGEEQVKDAMQLLREYRTGKTNLEKRIIADQAWWRMRNWEQMHKEKDIKGPGQHLSNTAWLWNCIAAKHADAMDSFPEPVILPREENDEEEAKRLSEIVPVVLQQAGFEEVYSDVSWQKMQEGTGIYGVFWDSSMHNGLGDVAIRKVSALNLFWQPGITDIQDSANVFLCALVDNEELERQYPQLMGNLGKTSITLAKYAYDDEVDTSKKSLVVDWYYKRGPVLHMAKLCGDQVLYATEDAPDAQGGLYEDGLYPFVLDVLFPVEGSPCGIGYIDIGKDTQADIDQMSTALVRNAIVTSTPRYFQRQDGGVNDKDFLDVTKPLVKATGNLNEDSLRPIEVPSMGSGAISVYQEKIEELKFVTGNTDVQNGSTPASVTAASAIAALQESSGRTSKDSNRAAYRAYAKLVTMVIERIRQHYEVARQFRIIGENGKAEYIHNYTNAALKGQSQGVDMGMDMGLRLPVFDVEVRAQRETSYTKTAQNELAIQLYQMGVFNPQMIDQVLPMIRMMDFRGKDDLMQQLQNSASMQAILQQVAAVAMVLAGKYEPQTQMQINQLLMTNPNTAQIAQQLMGAMGMGMQQQMGGGMQQAPRMGDATKLMGQEDDASQAGATRMSKAREQVAQSTRVE